MPNTHSTLTSLFTDIANAIRAKTGDSGTIIADEFPTAIASISGSTPPSFREVTITNNRTSGSTATQQRVLIDYVKYQEEGNAVVANGATLRNGNSATFTFPKAATVSSSFVYIAIRSANTVPWPSVECSEIHTPFGVIYYRFNTTNITIIPLKTDASDTVQMAIGDLDGTPSNVITLESLSVIENGTYTPSSGHAYSTVTVNVPTGSGDDNYRALIERTISVASGDASMIGVGAFQSCTTLTTASFPNATTIGSSAFQGCISLVSVSIPNATSIGLYAFSSCKSLTSVSFPMATYIGTRAFYSCDMLTSVYIPMASDIATAAFYFCPSLLSVSCPIVTSIGSQAFYECINLSLVSFPMVTSIGSSAFYECFKLAEAVFPNTTVVGAAAFCTCTPSLKKAIFNKDATIGSSAFSGCKGLDTVIIGCSTSNSATTIYSSAFVNCTGLYSLYMLGGTPPTIPNTNFLYNTPIRSSVSGVYGSIFVRSSLYSTYIVATNLAAFSSRFVSLTDEQVQHVIDYGTHIIE